MKLVTFLSLTMALTVPLFAKTLEVKRSTKIFASPDKSGAILKQLEKGDLVESVGRKGMFWKVKIGENQGFVSVLSVKRKVTKSNEIADVIRSQARESRASGESASIRSRSAVMGVRGLDESDNLATAGNIKPDLRAVYKMEDQHVIGSKVVNAYESRISKEIERILQKNQNN